MIKLRIRHLKTRETGVAEFPTEPEALLWLMKRPPMVDVIGVAGQTPPSLEVQERLRARIRPLDADEQIAEREWALEAERAELERLKEARRTDDELHARHAEEMRAADPDRLMEIFWRFDTGMTLTDPQDPRPIPDAAREAVLAWIAERCEWVAGRGQTVGECTVKVWPGTLPPKAESRVTEGRFTPVSADEVKT